MSYWSGMTRNLIMQNSARVRQHGGDLGSTTWSYVIGRDGVKTIDPAVGFYLNPPPNSDCRWSTDHGRYPPNHIVISNDGSEDAMPPRELADWNDDTIQSKVDQYRHQYWEELKYLVRPNTFEDLYELFDSATLWQNGAYNLWKLVNALITLAHDQFPHVLQEWKDQIKMVVYDIFRPVAGSRLVPRNNNMQVLQNQHVLTEWDRTVDPLVLLQHTSFPVGDLPLMNVQQHGLLRELLICEHIRLTGTQSPIPLYYNFARPVVHTAPTPVPDFVDNQSERAPVNSAVQNLPINTAMQVTSVDPQIQKSKSSLPLVVVGTNDADDELKIQPRDVPKLSKEQSTSATVIQSPVLSSSSPAPLPSISEEIDPLHTCMVPSSAEDELMTFDAKRVIPNGVNNGSTCPAEGKPTKVESSAPDVVTKESISITEGNATEAGAPVPNIVTKEATPPPDSPIRDRKDSNGSTDELFFPNAPSDKLQGGRQRSVASAPDQDTKSMLTTAEKTTHVVSETPPITQASQGHQQQSAFHLAPGASIGNNSNSQGSLQFPVSVRKQGRQQSGPIGHQMQPVQQHGRQMGSSPHSSQMMAPCGPPNGVIRGPGPYNPNVRPDSNGPFIPSPSDRLAGSQGFNPHYGPPPGGVMPMEPPMGLQMGPPMGPPFQHQMPQHIDHQFGPHGPPTVITPSPFMDQQSQSAHGYQSTGYFHQPRHYVSHGEQGDNGYSNNGYRNSNNSGGFNNQYNGKRRDSIHSNVSRKPRMDSNPVAVNSMPRQGNAVFPGRGSSNVGRPDQNRGRLPFPKCNNEKGLSHGELFDAKFVECSCVRCQESSRSVFVRMGPHDRRFDSDLQNALLKHFAQFNPVSVAKMRHVGANTTCNIEFHNDVDIARIIRWSQDSQNQAIRGIMGRVQVWYPLYSRYYAPRPRHGPQVRYQPHSRPELNRRESNPFRNQQVVDINDGYNYQGPLQYNSPNPSYNGLQPASSFPPPNGMIYQRVHLQNQPRVLYDPNDEPAVFKTEQKHVMKTRYSQDVRNSRSTPEGFWRPSQAKQPSEEAVAEEDGDAVNSVKDMTIVHSVKHVKASSLPTEEGSVREATSLVASRSGSPEADEKTHDNGSRLTTAGLTMSVETIEASKARNDTVTGGYSMTSEQLASAVEDVGYSTETVIRHRPGRPTIPQQWADAKAGDELHTRTPSPTASTQTVSANLNRINDVDRHMGFYRFRLSGEEFLQDLMSSGLGTVTDNTSSQNEASGSSAASAPTKTDTNDKTHASVDSNSATESQQKPKPFRCQRNKKRKNKGQGAGSHLTSRSNTPTDTQSRGPSPSLERPASADTSINGEVSTGMQNNNEVSFDAHMHTKRTNNKQAKNKRKRALLVSEVSGGQMKSSGSQDDKEQGALSDEFLQKSETSQGNPTAKSETLPNTTIEDCQAPHGDTIEKSSKGNFRVNNAGGSLRMTKNRSPEKGSQKNGPQGATQGQASIISEAISLPAVFASTAKEDQDVQAEAGLFAEQKFTIDQTKKSIAPKMSLQKSDSHTNTPNPAKNNDSRVALPKVALPLLQNTRPTNPRDDWASIAKRAVSHACRSNKQDDNDPFVVENGRVALGDFIKDKNVKSPHKPMIDNDKENVSIVKTSPTPSLEKKSCLENTTSKSQLNAAVKPFNPPSSCTSSAPSTRPRLNPNAATFSLPSSPSQSVASAIAPSHGRACKNAAISNTKKYEKPVASQLSVPPAERGPTKKGHAKKPSLRGHSMAAEKRLVTPAEQILDANKVMQPPPPSKESKRAGPIPDRSRDAGRGAVSTIHKRQIPAHASVAEQKKGFTDVDTSEQPKDVKAAPKAAAQGIDDAGAKPQSTSAKTSLEIHPDADIQTLNTESFPTLDQAAVAGPTKRRAASIVKAGVPAPDAFARVSGAVVGSDIKAPTQVDSSNQAQQSSSTGKNKQSHAQRSFTAPAPAVTKIQQSKVEQKQTNNPDKEPKQPGDKDNWQTVATKQKAVAPKQKNNSSGASKGHGGREGKPSSWRNARGGRGGRDSATEERKGG